MQPVHRTFVLFVADVGQLGLGRQVAPLDVGEGELGLAELLGQRRGRELLAHPVEEVAARGHAPQPEDRIPQSADPLPSRAGVRETGVRRRGEERLHPGGVVARDEERRDDRAGRGAGDVHPLLHAAVTLRGRDRPGERDPFHAAALEDGVGAMHAFCRHRRHSYSTCSMTQKSLARLLLVT